MSVEAWLKINAIDPGSTYLVVGDSFSWKLQMNNGALEFVMHAGSSIWNTLVDCNDNIVDDQWHYVVVAYDGSNADMYIDGINVQSQSGIYQIRNSSGYFNIGGSVGCCYFDSYIDSFPGIIDEVRI